MSPEKITAVEEILARYPVATRWHDGSERAPRTAMQFVTLMDPDYFSQQFGLPPAAKTFLPDLRAALTDDEIEEIYAYARAGEWPE